MTKTHAALAAGVGLVAVAALWLAYQGRDDASLAAGLDAVTEDFRRIIVLVDGSESLDQATRQRAIAAGRVLFWRKQETLDRLGRSVTGARGSRQLARYLTENRRLHDADKLAFLDLVETAAGGSDELKPVKDNLQSIQLTYREEVTRIFAQLTRGAGAPREKWESYLAELRRQYSREKRIAEYGDVTEEPADGSRGATKGNEVFGDDFPARTVALTFDDGPHPKYTEQVLALLRKYGIRACFFELGANLGSVSEAGDVSLSRAAEVAKRAVEAGHTLANHSFSHPQLPKLPEDQRAREIDRTNLLLERVAGRKAALFRAPYGARNHQILEKVKADGLKSVMWNIDSLDWADPIPESIAMRVLQDLTKN